MIGKHCCAVSCRNPLDLYTIKNGTIKASKKSMKIIVGTLFHTETKALTQFLEAIYFTIRCHKISYVKAYLKTNG